MAGNRKTPQQLAFGEWLRARRNELDLTSEQTAKMAGVDPTTWRSYEAPGEPARRPSPKTVKGIARALEVDPDEVARRAGVRLPHVFGEGEPVGAIISPSVSLDVLVDVLVALKELREEIGGLSGRLEHLEAEEKPKPRGRRPVS